MKLSEDFPCSDERCAFFIDESENPSICAHHHKYAEAIKYWGKVARDEITVDDVIDEYKDFLDFDSATSMNKYYDQETNWQGPTVNITVRVNHEPAKIFTVYPHKNSKQFPGFKRTMIKINGYIDGWKDATQENNE